MAMFLDYVCSTLIPSLQDDLDAVWQKFYLLFTNPTAGNAAAVVYCS